MTPSEVLQLAEAVVADGFAAHRPALAALFAGSRRLGVSETLVAIAAGPEEPPAARLRALGRVVVAYTAARAAIGVDADVIGGPVDDRVDDLTGDLVDEAVASSVVGDVPDERELCMA